jgi:hypothetical protein
MTKRRIPFREIANRITGFEIPVFGGGLSWNPPTLDIDVAKRLMTYLEDRRALYQPYEMETSRYVVQSIMDMRQRLTADLEQLERSSPLAQSIAAMRAACRKFLNEVEGLDVDLMTHRRLNWSREDRSFFMPLGELRAVMGIHIAQISIRYGIDVEESLTMIFPASPREVDEE